MHLLKEEMFHETLCVGVVNLACFMTRVPEDKNTSPKYTATIEFSVVLTS